MTSGHKAAHLIFELRERAEMMNPTLLIKRRHRFSPGDLEARIAAKATFGSVTCRAASTISPPLFTSATTQSAWCAR
jgi:hypothetical protein